MVSGLPHAYPFLFVDTILQSTAPPPDAPPADGSEAWQGRVLARISGNGRASMTGSWGSPILLAEAVAQAALLLSGEAEESAQRGFLAGLDDWELTRSPRPGESVEIAVKLSARFGAIVKFEGEITCGGETLGRGSVLVRKGGG